MDLDRLDALLADASADAAARARAHTRWLRQAAEDEATFAGSLLDAAERGDAVVVRTTGGRSHRGTVRTVGRDFVVLAGQGLPGPLFVATTSIAWLRAAGGGDGRRGRSADVASSRPPPRDISLAAALSRLAGDRPRVHVGVVGETTLLLGELRSVGADVIALRLETEGRPVAVVPTANLVEVLLLDV